MAAPSSISAHLKTAILPQDLTAADVGRLANIDQGIVSRFLTGKRGLTLATLDQVAAALGLRLVEGVARRPTKARPPKKAVRPASRPQTTPE